MRIILKFFIGLITLSCFIFSCTNQTKSTEIKNTQIDHDQLNSYVKDSIDQPLKLNQNFIENFNSWDLVSAIESTTQIKDKETETFPFLFEMISLELDKIKFENAPEDLNIPQVIGRFRVYKTNILKINSIDLNIKNFLDYKNNLKNLISSHNALVNMLNLTANEIEEKNLIIQD